jgi:hypothetical protein
MYTLLSKLAEILSEYFSRFLDRKKTGDDTEVASELVQLLVFLQELCVQGEALLLLAEDILRGQVSPAKAAEFEKLLTRQRTSITELQETITDNRTLLATIDAQFYAELAPFLDRKSGMLTRWLQQASQSPYSTTTLFFLSNSRLNEVLSVARSHYLGAHQHSAARTEYLLAAADAVREARAHEVRDLRYVSVQKQPFVEAGLSEAHAQLSRIKEFISELFDAVQASIGAEALAQLRRQLMSEVVAKRQAT